MDQELPSLEIEYPRLRALFFAALARLSRHGFTVSPDDGIDLIHDFFAEAWLGLEARFDPKKGSFERYAYSAFIKFARPRIVRLKRWQRGLMGTEELELLGSESASKLADTDEERLSAAIANLPEGHRRVLIRYVYGEYSSERFLAKELGISRYRLRAILIEALGRLTVSFDRPSGITPDDWSVAQALWRDHRTIQETAKILEITPQQVRSACSRNVEFLSQILKHYEPHEWSPERKRNMMMQQQMNDVLDLLKRALRKPGDPVLLKEVSVHASDILQALESTDTPTIEEGIDDVPAAWVADVYHALFEASASKEIAAEFVAAEAWEVHENEDIAIGRAFRETLLADLGDVLQEPAVIAALPKLDQSEQDRLRSAPDVEAGKPESEWWLTYGVRPVTVFIATEAVSGLLSRYVRRGSLPGGTIVLGNESLTVSGKDHKTFLLSNLLREEISLRAECSDEIAAALYSWLLEVGQRKAWLFAGFRATPGPQGTLRLARSDEQFDEIYQRWGLGLSAETPKPEATVAH